MSLSVNHNMLNMPMGARICSKDGHHHSIVSKNRGCTQRQRILARVFCHLLSMTHKCIFEVTFHEATFMIYVAEINSM